MERRTPRRPSRYEPTGLAAAGPEPDPCFCNPRKAKDYAEWADQEGRGS